MAPGAKTCGVLRSTNWPMSPVRNGSRWTLSAAVPAPSSNGCSWHSKQPPALGPVTRIGRVVEPLAAAAQVGARHARVALAAADVGAAAVERVEGRAEQLVADLERLDESLAGGQGVQLGLFDVLGDRAVDVGDVGEVGDDRPRRDAGEENAAAEEEGDAEAERPDARWTHTRHPFPRRRRASPHTQLSRRDGCHSIRRPAARVCRREKYSQGDGTVGASGSAVKLDCEKLGLDRAVAARCIQPEPCRYIRTALSVETFIATPAELACVFAERLVFAARRAQTDGRVLSLVLPGGSVAQAFLPVVAEARIDWALVELFWGDERAVPPDHPESNYRLADQLLLGRVSIDGARVHRMPADDADLDAGARAYEAELVRVLGDPTTVRRRAAGRRAGRTRLLAVSGSPGAHETSRRVVAVTDSPKPPRERLTLTLAALEGAEVYIAAFGASKAEAVREALTTSTSPLPVARAARAGARAVFMLDTDAAGR